MGLGRAVVFRFRSGVGLGAEPGSRGGLCSRFAFACGARVRES